MAALLVTRGGLDRGRVPRGLIGAEAGIHCVWISSRASLYELLDVLILRIFNHLLLLDLCLCVSYLHALAYSLDPCHFPESVPVLPRGITSVLRQLQDRAVHFLFFLLVSSGSELLAPVPSLLLRMWPRKEGVRLL